MPTVKEKAAAYKIARAIQIANKIDEHEFRSSLLAEVTEIEGIDWVWELSAHLTAGRSTYFEVQEELINASRKKYGRPSYEGIKALKVHCHTVLSEWISMWEELATWDGEDVCIEERDGQLLVLSTDLPPKEKVLSIL